MTARALIADPLGPAAERVLLDAGFEVKKESGLAGEALVASLHGRQALLVRGATKVTAEVLRAARDLRVVARAGAGVDNIDAAAARECGVAVFNAPGANAGSVAELTWGLVLAALRHVPEADASLRAGRWEKNRLGGREVRGSTLGVVGLGHVGREVARLGQAFGCTVLGFDAAPAAYERAPGVTRVGLDDLFARSHIVTLHVPLDGSTRHLASRERMQRMPRGAVLVNAARGGLVDEVALAELVASGHLGGCALDVYEHEPPAADHPLFGLPNAVLTPHLGGSTPEAQERAALSAAHAVRAYLAGESPPGRVV